MSGPCGRIKLPYSPQHKGIRQELGSICSITAQMSILRRRVTTLRCTWRLCLYRSNSYDSYWTTARTHMHDNRNQKALRAGSYNRRHEIVQLLSEYCLKSSWKRDNGRPFTSSYVIGYVCTIGCIEWIICRKDCVCYLTLPSKYDRILRIHSVNNGIYVQTDVGLYPNSRIRASPSTTTYEILARSPAFKPHFP